MLKRGCSLFVNRSSGGYSEAKVSAIVDSLRRGGVDARLVSPNTAHEMEKAVQAACSGNDSPLLIVVGGDGTVNTVVNGIVGNGATIGYIPLGTANVLAHELGIDSVETAVKLIIRGDSRECSIGLVRTPHSTRRFLLMAGVGFDGQVVHGVTSRLKRSLGKGAYVVSALRGFFRWDCRQLRVVAGDEALSCHSVIFCNASRYGGNIVLAREASLFNHGLIAICIQPCRRFSWIIAVLRLILGKGRAVPGCSLLSGDNFVVQGVKAVQLDGDSAGFSPLTVCTEPGILRIIC